MSQKRIQQIEQRIDRIKKALLEIGPMRPGSLSRQYKDPPHQAGAYWQISYTRRMKSRTEYVRREWVKEIRRQTATHKRFKRLVNQTFEPLVSRGLAANLLHPFPADVLRAALHPAGIADLPVGPGLVWGILVLAAQRARTHGTDLQ